MTGNQRGARGASRPVELTTAECEALAAWADKRCPKLTARTGAPLARLIEPVLAATAGWSQVDAAELGNLLLREVDRGSSRTGRGTSRHG